LNEARAGDILVVRVAEEAAKGLDVKEVALEKAESATKAQQVIF
jgi:hypothetical protein